jgi:hypothetical protein
MRNIINWKIENKSALILGIVAILCGFTIVGVGAILIFPSLFVYPTTMEIANYATFIATIVLIFTVLEMKEQRKTTYKPLIILKTSDDLYYQFIFDPDDKNPLFFSLVNKNIPLNDKENVANSQFQIFAYNLGLGAAQNIKIQYTCNYLKFIEEINEYKVNEDLEIIHSNNCIKIRFQRGRIKFNLKNHEYLSFDYILPANIEKNPLRIPLPEPFKHLYSALIFSSYYSDMQKVMKVPDITINITYNDIAGNLYKKEYVLKFKPRGIQGTLVHSILYSLGFLEIKELR